MRSKNGVWLCLILSVIGMALSSYLYYLHLGLLRGELIVAPGCGSGAFNCHAVTGSSWGYFLGMPLALWGLLGYGITFALSFLALQSVEWVTALVLIRLLAALFFLVDLVLFCVMLFVIHFYCTFCLLTYGVSLALLLFSHYLIGRQRVAPPSFLALFRQAHVFWGLLVVIIFAVVGVHSVARFVSLGDPEAFEEQLRQYIARQPRVAVSTTNDPELGSADASMQVVEFSDFFCPSCQRASKMNTIILAGHQRDTRFVFKHFPLDTACNSSINRMVHPGACEVAAASECAHLQGKFWKFHDRVFEKGSKYRLADVKQDAQNLGLDVAQFSACLESGQGMEAVKRDVAEGIRLGISSTPTYLINGVPMAGGVTPTVFEKLKILLREGSR